MEKRFLIFAAACLCLASLLNAGTFTREFDEVYTLKKGGEFNLENTNGSILVQSWDQEEVRINALIRVRSGSRRSAEDMLDRVDIHVRETSNSLSVITRTPPSSGGGFLSWLFGGSGGSVSVEYRIYVPDQVNITLKNTNGKISIKNVEGDIDLNTTNGAIEGQYLRGNLLARTTNGNVSLKLDAGERDKISARTTNGGILIYLPVDSHANIEVNTTNGSISTDMPITIRGRSGKRQLGGYLGNGGGESIRLKTTNGSIRIREM